MNTRIQGKTVVQAASQEAVYNWLCNYENFRALMPDDVAKFEMRENGFVFGLRGMPDVKLIGKENIPHHTVSLQSASDKVSFVLRAAIESSAGGGSEVQLLFEGDFNPMLKMMVERPLRNFLEQLSSKLETVTIPN